MRVDKIDICTGRECFDAFESSNQSVECDFLRLVIQTDCSIARNVSTLHGAVKLGETIFPITVNGFKNKNCYVVSPYAAYIDYAREELEMLKSRVPKWPFAMLIKVVAPFLQFARVDDCVHVNNWLLSTNLYPRWDGENLLELTAKLTDRFPNRYVYFRSLNHSSNSALMTRFVEAGYRLLPARQVYIFDAPSTGWHKKANTRRDIRLLEETDLKFVSNDEFRDDDFGRIQRLYDALYLEKYTALNPQFTSSFLKRAHTSKIFHFEGYRSLSGELVAVVGTFALGGTITAPIVGYDTNLPQSKGLYRILMALVFRRAMTTGMPLNLSAGAASFKRLRGGEPFIEYTAVYDRHLSPYQRFVIGALKTFLNKLGVPIMKKYQL